MTTQNYFKFHKNENLFQLILPGFPSLKFQSGYRLENHPSTILTWKSDPQKDHLWLAKDKRGEWKLSVRATKDARIKISMEARLKVLPKNLCLQPVIFKAFGVDHILAHGRTMKGCESLSAKSGKRRSVESYFFTSLTKRKHTLQISLPLKQKEISKCTGDLIGGQIKNLTISTYYESPRTRMVKSAPVTIEASMEPHRQLIAWAEEQVDHADLIDVPQESGWNTWDYYRWTINEEEVLKNADFIASDPILSRHIKKITIDDGWQYCYGEWEANFHFPSGMKSLARQLTRMGFSPGLWFAPTIAELHSRFAQLEPELLACAPSGIPCLAYSCMERKGFLLDPTHPRVQAWWDALFRRYVGYGYRSFKLDFLSWTVASRKFFAPKTAPGELMEAIVRPIRQAVGPHIRLLGCNFGFEGGRGLTDEVRVSADVHARWAALRSHAVSVASRFWSHRRLWINDPDFALCRSEATSHDPEIHRLKPLLPFVHPNETKAHTPGGMPYLSSLVDFKTANETEILLSLVIASGGAMNFSDNLPRLNDLGVHLLRRAVQAEKGNAAIPLDLFHSEAPTQWLQQLDSGTCRILLINWNDHPTEISCDLHLHHISSRSFKNFWKEKSFSIKNNRLTTELPPRSCLLLES